MIPEAEPSIQLGVATLERKWRDIGASDLVGCGIANCNRGLRKDGWLGVGRWPQASAGSGACRSAPSGLWGHWRPAIGSRDIRHSASGGGSGKGNWRLLAAFWGLAPERPRLAILCRSPFTTWPTSPNRI